MVAEKRHINSDQRPPGLWRRFLSLFRASPESGATSLSKPSTWFTALFGPTSKSGVQVTPKSVISLTAMWRAVNILSETIASLPFEVIEQLPGGDIRIATEHPIYQVINVEPNQLYTSFTYRHTSMAHACIHGNWISVLNRNARTNQVSSLTIVDASKVEPVIIRNEETGADELFYRVKYMDKTFPASDVIHIPNLSFSGIAGLNPMSIHQDNFGMGLAGRDYINTYFKNGTMIGGWIEYPDTLEDQQYNRMKSSFRLEYGGADNAGTTPILEGGAKYHKINASLGDAQSIEAQKFNIEDISRITGVPVHMLQSLDRATFNNIEQLSLEFATYTIRPWVKRIEQEFNRKIFREQDKGRYKVRLNMDALLRADSEGRANMYKTLWGMGAISVNEIRRMEKMNSVENGDMRFIPLNMAHITPDGQITNPNKQDNDEAMRGFETLKAKLDAYGIGVRAGAFTPQQADEAALRAEAGLPNAGDAVNNAWEEDEGYRRPITLKLKQEVEKIEEQLDDPEPGENSNSPDNDTNA